MSASHRHTFDTIPWLVNGRIGEDERRSFDAHLRNCAECSAELARQQQVYNAIHCDEPRVDYAPGGSLQKLWSRIDDQEQAAIPPVPASSSNSRGPRHWAVQWLVAAVVVEAIGMTLLGTRPGHDSMTSMTTDDYRTVTTTEIVRKNVALRVVFSPSFTVTQVNTLLHQHHLEIVSGPSDAGVYTLATTASIEELPSGLPHVLASLRDNPGVRLAEPIVRADELKP